LEPKYIRQQNKFFVLIGIGRLLGHCLIGAYLLIIAYELHVSTEVGDRIRV